MSDILPDISLTLPYTFTCIRPLLKQGSNDLKSAKVIIFHAYMYIIISFGGGIMANMFYTNKYKKRLAEDVYTT